MSGYILNTEGYWYRVISDIKPDYKITGKYLFFSEDRDRLINIAINEVSNYGFHHAKVNSELLGRNTEYVLCIYYKDDSRKHELLSRSKEDYPDVKYRWWKSDADTIAGKYSKEFLDNTKVGARATIKGYTDLVFLF